MSHFSTLVALPPVPADWQRTLDEYVHAQLEKIMDKWDENKDVPPYRDYEEGAAGDYWAVKGFREEGLLPKEGDVTWPEVVAVYNKKYGDSEDEPLHFDEERGEAYKMSTYNPDSKWDYWRVGGRWGGYFTPANGTDPDDVLWPEHSWDSPPADELRGKVNGGRVRALDLKLMREVAAGEAGNKWQRVIDRLASVDMSEYQTWRELSAAIDNGVYTIDEARDLFFAQPAVQAMRELFPEYFDTPNAEDFTRRTREEYEQRAADAAVPGYAFVDLEGNWVAPGRMGWFGMSSDEEDDRALYRRKVNAYVDALAATDTGPEHILVSLDLHI